MGKKHRLTRLTGAALVLLAWLFAGGLATAEAQTPMRFRDTPGAQAFLAKRYQDALREFRKLREANPNHVVILRYLAITLDRLNRYDEAVAVFKEALAVAPNNVALHFFLGVTLYNARRGAEAVVRFQRAISLAPQSMYAELATRYLDAIAQQQMQQQQPGAPQRFGVYAQAGVKYDDNVLSAPDGFAGKRSDSRQTGYLLLEYYLHRSPTWLAAVEINGYGIWYNDRAFNSLEVSQYSGGVRLQRVGTLRKYPYVGSIKYGYNEVRLSEGDVYSRSNALTLGLRLNLSANTATYGYYQYTDDDFTEEGFDPVFSSRDANNHAMGLRHTWFFAKRKGQVNMGLDYQKNNAAGVNFVMEGISANIGAITPLPWKLRADLKFAYGEDDYRKFAGPVRRETHRRRYGAGLSRWFGRRVLVRLDYSYVDEDSSYEQLTYDREAWGASVSYVY
jgi:hypothetical protein